MFPICRFENVAAVFPLVENFFHDFIGWKVQTFFTPTFSTILIPHLRESKLFSSSFFVDYFEILLNSWFAGIKFSRKTCFICWVVFPCSCFVKCTLSPNRSRLRHLFTFWQSTSYVVSSDDTINAFTNFMLLTIEIAVNVETVKFVIVKVSSRHNSQLLIVSVKYFHVRDSVVVLLMAKI